MYYIARQTYIQSNNQLAYNINLKKYHLYVINKNKEIANKKFGPYSNQYFETSKKGNILGCISCDTVCW